MKLSYDAQHNVAYIRLREKSGDLETLRISDELLLDVGPDGTVFGIELLNAREQLQAADQGQLIVVDDASGKQQSITLPSAAE